MMQELLTHEAVSGCTYGRMEFLFNGLEPLRHFCQFHLEPFDLIFRLVIFCPP